MGSILRRGLRAAAALVAASILLGGTGLASADQDARTATPGSAGVGDYLYPNLGNGGYDARHYDLTLRYPTAAPTQPVHGVVRMDAVATQDLSRFDLDYGGDAVESVRVNGRSASFDWQQAAEELVITPPQALRRDRGFTVEVAFTSSITDPAGNLVAFGWLSSKRGSFTSFQPNVAHKSFPLNDHPSDKATYTFHVDVPQGITAIANGMPACQPQTAAGRTVWSYEQRSPMAAELIQVAVGDDLTIVQRGTVDGVTYRDVIANGKRELLDGPFAGGPSQLQWLTAKIGRFPFAEYGNLGVDQGLGYALETQGLTLHSYGLFDPNFLPEFGTGQPEFYNPIMIHEGAHQWFGNSVSPRMWSDVWLNEGWATWFEREFEQETGIIDWWGFASFEEYMRAQYAQGDLWRLQYGPVARPLPPEENLYFSPQIYDGAATALFALHERVGDRTFRDILRGWAQQYQDRSVSTDDFIRFASRVAGQDLGAFLRDWLYGTTTPAMPGHPDWTVDPVETAKTAAAARTLAKPANGPAWLHTRGGHRDYGLAAGS